MKEVRNAWEKKESHVCHHRVPRRTIFVDFLIEDKMKCLPVSKVYPPPKTLVADAQDQVCSGAAMQPWI